MKLQLPAVSAEGPDCEWTAAALALTDERERKPARGEHRSKLLSTSQERRAWIHHFRSVQHPGSAAKAALNDCPHGRKAEGAHLAAFVSCIPLLDGPVIWRVVCFT